MCANYVRDICEDKQGDIWIGTFRGLNKYMPLTDNFISYPNTSRDMLASSTSVWSLLCDNQGIYGLELTLEVSIFLILLKVYIGIIMPRSMKVLA